jgi:uncharacterized protein (DUF2147 family)
MKTTILAAAFALASGAAFADPIEGLWQTQPDDGAYAHVQIAPCGANFCGTIVRTFNDGGEYQSPNLGKQIVSNMAPKGNGAYEGKVWRPSNGKTYLGKIALNGTAMKLAGCVAGGLICAKQNWTKIK